MKTCGQCKKTKSEDSFRKRRRTAGLLVRFGTCKACEAKYHKAHVQENPQPGRDACNRYARKHRAYILIRWARERAIEKGMEFDLDKHRAELQERMDLGVCELTGIPLTLTGKRSFNSPSLDRIDASRGYTYDNVRIICFAMNAALGNWGEETLHAVVTAWLGKRQGERPSGEVVPEVERTNIKPSVRIV